MLTNSQQFLETINRSNRFLVTFRPHADGDTVGSALAVAHLLRKMGKDDVLVASHGFTPPSNLKFLPRVEDIRPSLEGVHTFTIELDTKNVKVKDIRYDQEEEKLRIFVTPEHGMFRDEDMIHKTSPFAYDCIITVDTADLESLGDLYHKHADFFYQTPIINIDCDPGNEHHGQVNVVDITATATGEVVFHLVESVGTHHLDVDLATYLLTAIIAKTRSFRTPRITPRTLQITSQLVAHGADRETIVHHLYRTRSLSTLKLWGRVLSRLEHDKDAGLAWSSLTTADFERTGATEEHLSEIVDELIANSPGVKTTALLYEDHTHKKTHPTQSDAPVCVLVCTTPPHSAMDLVHDFDPQGSKTRAHFRLPTHTIHEAEREIIGKLKDRMMAIQK